MLLIRLYQNLHKSNKNIKEWWIECLQKHLFEAEAVTENAAVPTRAIHPYCVHSPLRL